MNEDNKSFISTIEPYCVLKAVLHNLWMIIFAGIIGFLAATMVLEMAFAPQYTSTITFVVTSRSGTTTYYTDTSAAKQTAATFSELLQSSLMKKIAAEELNTGSISGDITAEQTGETNIITVTATADNPKDAFQIIKAVENNYAEISDYISRTAVLRVLDRPRVSATAANAASTRDTAVKCGYICALAMLAAIVWLFISRETVQNREGAKVKLDARLIAVIPHEQNGGIGLFKKSGKKKKLSESLLISAPTRSYGFCESMRMVSARLEHEKEKGNSVFMFTSISESEGKSTVSANTAISLCNKGYKVLIIDVDTRKPAQKRLLLKNNEVFKDFGAMFENESYTPAEIVANVYHMKQSGLDTLLNVKPYRSVSEKLLSDRMAEIIRIAKEKYDYVIIDTPPMGYFADSEAMTEVSDAAILVARQDVAPAEDINDGIDTLQSSNAKLLGVVLNDVHYLLPSASVYGYGSYGYGRRKSGYGRGYGYGDYSTGNKARKD